MITIICASDIYNPLNNNIPPGNRKDVYFLLTKMVARDIYSGNGKCKY